MLLIKYFDKNGAIINKINIKIILNTKVIGIVDNTIFLLLLVFSLTSFDIEVGRPNVDKVINKLKVGITNIYCPIPSVDTTLVKTILITILSILVIKPPIIKIIVDLINLLFTLSPIKYMK